jgi:chromosome segregation ATPase
MRRKRSEIIARRSREAAPLEKRFSKIENQIETREAELTQLNHSMQQAAQDKDGNRIGELSQAIHACQAAIDRLFEELEQISNEIESRNAVFERQLGQLDIEIT